MNKRLVYLELLASILSIGLGIYLHVRTENWGLAVSIALGAEVVIHLFGFTFRYGPVLDAIRDTFPADGKPHGLERISEMSVALHKLQMHAIPLRLLTNTLKEWYLQDRYDQIVTQLQKDLLDLDRGHFTMPMTDILAPSFRVCKEIQTSAFCTALQKHLGIFLESEKGPQLLKANYEAAERLKSKQGFTRLFILENLGSVTLDRYKLMQDNVDNGINVLVLLRDQLNDLFKRQHMRQLTDDELDFGLWDNKYKMTIVGTNRSRWMTVSATPEDLKEAREVKGALEEAAQPWQDFNAVLRTPLNAAPFGGWSSRPEKILHLPPPNGPYQQDVEAMWEIASEHLSGGGTLAILGLTHALIEKARAFQLVTSNSSVEVVDCRDYRPPVIDKIFRFRKSNWLEWEPSTPCDVIVGDDVLCNLGTWQIPMFFQAVARALKRGGVFIVRTTAIYSPDTMHPGRVETATRLRAVKAALKEIFKGRTNFQRESATYEIAWPMLHSREYYNRDLCMFNLVDWDTMISDEFKDDAQFGNYLRLPYHVKVTSVDYSLLKEWSEGLFEIRQEELPVHSVWASDPEYRKISEADEISSTFKEYYRILVFTRL